MTTLEEIQAAKAAAARAEMAYIQTHVEAAHTLLSSEGMPDLRTDLKAIQDKLPNDGEDYRQLGNLLTILTHVPAHFARRVQVIEAALNPPPAPQMPGVQPPVQ